MVESCPVYALSSSFLLFIGVLLIESLLCRRPRASSEHRENAQCWSSWSIQPGWMHWGSKCLGFHKAQAGIELAWSCWDRFYWRWYWNMNSILHMWKGERYGKFSEKCHSGIRIFGSWWSLIKVAISKGKTDRSPKGFTVGCSPPGCMSQEGWGDLSCSRSVSCVPLPCIPLASPKLMQIKFWSKGSTPQLLCECPCHWELT